MGVGRKGRRINAPVATKGEIPRRPAIRRAPSSAWVPLPAYTRAASGERPAHGAVAEAAREQSFATPTRVGPRPGPTSVRISRFSAEAVAREVGSASSWMAACIPGMAMPDRKAEEARPTRASSRRRCEEEEQREGRVGEAREAGQAQEPAAIDSRRGGRSRCRPRSRRAPRTRRCRGRGAFRSRRGAMPWTRAR